MEIVGDNWDAVIFSALAADPPPPGLAPEAQEDHVLRVILASVGDSLRGFFRRTAPRLAAVAGPLDADPIHLYVSWMVEYYRRMQSLLADPGENLPGWERAGEVASRLACTSRPLVVATFQLGYPLLAPVLAAAGGHRVAILLHGQNEFARRFFEERIPGVALHFLEKLNAFDLLRSLSEGRILVANLDVAYPGTRSLEMSFLGGRLSVPEGIFLLGRRAGAELQCVALPWAPEGISPVLGPRLDLRSAPPREPGAMLQGFFEPLVTAHPFQWMGWGGLR